MRNFLLSIVLGFFGTLVCLLALGSEAPRLYQMPTNAMEPAIHVGDKIAEVRIVGLPNASRGQVVAFRLPHDPEKIAIRRVVGLPGDRVRIAKGTLILNGSQQYEPYIRIAEQSGAMNFPSTFDTLLDEGEIRRLQNQMYAEWIRNKELTVPEGYYFVLSDNRNQATDSRYYGPVPQSNVFARPIFVYASGVAGGARRFIDSYIIGPPRK